MSDYGRIVTTNQGKNMVTESIRTKSAIIFTKISLGDGLLNGETIETMTGLKHGLLNGNVPKIKNLGNGEIEAVSTVNNSELTAGFFARELGLFAKLGEEGEEQLFAYTNAGSNASYIPPNTSADEKMLGIQLGVGDAVVQVNYQSHLYITYEQLDDAITHHNSDEHAHDDRFNAIIEKVNNMITTTDDGDKQSLAPTLALVKTLLSNLNIKNSKDVIKAIDTETLASLGVRYDLSNQNAWYISFGKLFGGLIIQGGMENEYYDVNATNKLKTFTYPIAFKNIPLYINPTSLHYEDSYLVTFPRVLQREVTNTDFKLNHVELHSAAQKVKISYIAIGI